MRVCRLEGGWAIALRSASSASATAPIRVSSTAWSAAASASGIGDTREASAAIPPGAAAFSLKNGNSRART